MPACQSNGDLPGSDASTLVELLRRCTQQFPSQRAFTFLNDGEADRRHINYHQLDAQARAIAADLQARGAQGERALLIYPSGIDFIAAFFGCLYAGVTAVPAYPPRRNRNLARVQSIVADARPAVALTTSSVYDRVAPTIAEHPDLEALPWVRTDAAETGQAAAWREPEIDASTLAFLQYTSGSTGTPKGVMLSHANLLHNTAMISGAFRPSPWAGGVTWLPLYHDMGLIGGIIQPIYFGRPTTVMTPTHFLQKPYRWLRAMSDLGAEISGGPNFAYELCVERVTEEEKATLDLSQWEVAFNGAEPVRVETMERFAEAFAPCGFRPEAFYPCYGLAEGTLMVTGGEKERWPTVASFDAKQLQQDIGEPASADGEGALRIVASGEPRLGQQVVIAQADDDSAGAAECEPGRIGEIWVSGPSVAQGYWERPDLTEQTFGARLADGRGPYLRTGDLGFLHNGELFVTGRRKDLIIIRGANHYPQDIELTVEQSHECLPPSAGAAVAVGDDGAERLVVVQEIPRARDLPFEEICTAIRSQIAEHHDVAPAAIALIKPNSIPKTSSGKIQRHAARRAFLEGELSVMADWTSDAGLTIRRRRGARAGDGQPATNGHANGHKNPAKPTTPASTTSPEDQRSVAERVQRIVRRVASERAAGLTLDTSIVAMGLDSLERMEIVALVEDEFCGRFSEEAVLGMETCRDVVNAVEAMLAGGRSQADQPREVERGDYDFAASPEYRRLRQNFDAAEAAGFSSPYFTEHEGLTNDRTTIGGREYINWCSYNYLGMSGDPAVDAAAQQAIDRYGTSVSASRLVSGEKTVHRELEQAIANLVGAEASVAMVGGHATNETVIGHLLGPGDLILHDALAHNSIVQGCRLSGAHRRAFPHNDASACGALLERYRTSYRRVLIAIEGVYSMDGDFSPLPDFVALRNEHKAYLMVDEAHSIGTMGKTGRGMGEHFDVHPRDVDIWMGTVSKGLGSCGGYIAGRAELIEYLKYTAPGFVYSNGMPPSQAAAAIAAIELLEAEPTRVERLRENSELLLRLLKQAGMNTGLSGGTPIVPVITGSSLLALQLSKALFAEGINVQPILHPAVEEAAARLRFFVTSMHSEEQIRRTVEVLAQACERLRDASDQPTLQLSSDGGVQQAAAGG